MHVLHVHSEHAHEVHPVGAAHADAAHHEVNQLIYHRISDL